MGTIMKRSVLLTVVSLMLLWFQSSAALWAFDRQLMVESGQTLYFNFVEGGVEVVHPNDTPQATAVWTGYTRPAGARTVPSVVSFNGVDYTVVSIGNYAFYGCNNLTAVTISEGIATLGNGAFSHCSAITELRLPSTLMSVGSGAFGYMDALADVWITAANPPTGQYAFNNTNVANSTLHVVCGTESAYQNDAVWGQFGSVDVVSCMVTVTALANYEVRGTVTGGGNYPMGSTVTLEAVPDSSFFFACWNDGDTVNPRQLTATEDCSFTAMFFAVHTFAPDTIRLISVVHDTVHDTLITTVYDTVHDAVPFLPTIFQVSILSADPALGVGVGSGDIPGGIEIEVCALPLEGAVFVSWNDGSTENPRRLTVESNVTLMAHFEQSTTTGIGELGIMQPFTTTVKGHTLTVNATAGSRLNVFDSTGRKLFSSPLTSERMVLQLPSAGVYLVQVDDSAARKIVVR